MHNFFKFVVKGGKCRVEHPLFGFYILIILTLIADMIYSIMIVKVSQEDCWMPFVLYMPPTFKCLSGVEQIWMLVELTLHVRIEIKMHRKGNLHSERELLDELAKFIVRGRIFILTINIAVIVLLTAASIYINAAS